MRLVAAIVFFVIAAFGVLLGVVYPLTVAYEEGYELERLRVFSAGLGFTPVETRLPWREEQVLIRIEAATARIVDTGRDVVLTMTVTSDGRTEIAQAFTFDGVEPRDRLPELPVQVYSLEGETLTFIGDDPYVFVFGPGEVEIPLVYVDLVLTGGTYEIDEVVPPIGWVLIAVGLIGFVLSARKRRERSGPPPPKWGRG